jgi:type I restriction enzyme S subunit
MKHDNELRLRKDWEIKNLGEVCDFQGGSQPPKSQFSYEPKEGYVRFLQIRDFASDKNITFIPESKKNRYCNVDDILLGRYGASVGKVLVNKEGAFNVAIMKTIPNESILFKRYLFYYLNTNEFQTKLLNTASRSAQDGFSKDDIFDFPILIPPLPEQHRIIAILDDAFAKFDKAKANAEQNLKNAKDLFESYLQGVFEKKGDDWEEVRFDDLCKLTRGHNPPKSKFINEPKEGYIRFYQIRDGWADNYAVYVPDTPQLHKVKPDEILMVAYRHIGKVFRGVTGAFNVALCKISNMDRNKLNNDFLFYIIPTDVVKGELMKRSERSLIPSMSVEHLKEILIPLPPIKEQIKIVQKLDAISSETKKLEAIYEQKIKDLEELKKSVLQKAFSGEL